MRHFIDIAKSLTLKTLYLGLNINPEGMRLFAEASSHLGQLEYLNLNGVSQITDLLWTHFAAAAEKMSSLTRLDVCQRVGQQMALFGVSFQYFAKLKALSLSFNALGAKGMEEFAVVSHHLTSLSKLVLEGNSLCDEGMKHFKTAAQNLPSLTDVNLDDNCIGDVGISYLLEALAFLPLLKVAHLNDNEINDDAMSHFVNCESLGSLEYLSLARNPITSFGLCHLASASIRMPALRVLSLAFMDLNSTIDMGEITYWGISYLGDFKFASLEDLDLSGNNLGSSSSRMREFVRVSPNLAFLKRLNLAWNELRDEGMCNLADAAKNLTSLVHLDVSANDLRRMDPFKMCLRPLTALKEIVLEENDIKDEGIKFMQELLDLRERKRKIDRLTTHEPSFKKKMKLETES